MPRASALHNQSEPESWNSYLHKSQLRNLLRRRRHTVTMASTTELKVRRRQDYHYHLDYRTRWSDNDMYDHMNKSVYGFLVDSVIYAYLIEHCNFHPPTSEMYGLAVHADTDFFSSIAYPAVAELGLRVNKLGKSSVTYEVAIFELGVEEVKVVGQCVHVFVERSTGRPSKSGMSPVLRQGLEKLYVRPNTSKL
ncbi:HotDog domain-containing protein [Ilyonectria sp. MPI-CAGE-AT-0026]|nr:HotDog domain-containing protein [Ilyonectria sp. MPI-CAGE-AT-0026]